MLPASLLLEPCISKRKKGESERRGRQRYVVFSRNNVARQASSPAVRTPGDVKRAKTTTTGT
jgi:hypothetical protein